MYPLDQLSALTDQLTIMKIHVTGVGPIDIKPDSWLVLITALEEAVNVMIQRGAINKNTLETINWPSNKELRCQVENLSCNANKVALSLAQTGFKISAIGS